MKLSNRILYYFIIAISIVIIISVITSSLAFKTSLESYLESTVNEEFQSIAEEISIIYSRRQMLKSEDLAYYANDKSINIRVLNNDKKVLAEFIGIAETDYPNKTLIKQNFNVKDSQDNTKAIIEISYLEDLTLYNNSITNFLDTMVRSYAIIIIISILLGVLLMIYFSRKIVKPISEMNEFTKNLKKGEYGRLENKYNTYEIDELSTNLNYLADTLSLEEENRLNYAQDIAHELRTPITNILLHLEGIRDDVIEADRDTITMLIDEVNRLNGMINHLHLSFRSTDDANKLVFEDIEINETISNITASFKPKFDEKNIELSLDLPNEIHHKLDKEKFIQVINNLLSNAIKAVDDGGKIAIKTNEYKNRIVISVKDNGIGIDKKDLDNIFERFYRVDSDRNRKTGGSGLGLAITKGFIEMQGGNITVNSTKNKGSEFIITFPKSKKIRFVPN